MQNFDRVYPQPHPDIADVLRLAERAARNAGNREWAEKLYVSRHRFTALTAIAHTAEVVIRNCANAGQIGEGYLQYADELREALDAAQGGAK